MLKETVSLELLEFIQDKIKQEADLIDENAAYSGRQDLDSSDIRYRLQVYLRGYEKTLPTEWVRYRTEFENLRNPEYAEYLRLKAIFDTKG
jgi:hypothetical protein